LKECLEGVCREGTAEALFKNSFYKVAGKTGTALVANGSRGYADHIYQSSFAGYFPADNPKYSCIVVIKNKPFAKKFYGATVAGPVFKELADKLMSEEGPLTGGYLTADAAQPALKRDSAQFYYAGATRDMKQVMETLGVNYADSAGKSRWGRLYAVNYQSVLNKNTVSGQSVPDVKGMGLKDALYLLESMNMRVTARGTGKVKTQSMEPGTALAGHQTIILELN
jgi:cell division protein FtsI (penicillin-binding protein 3)